MPQLFALSNDQKLRVISLLTQSMLRAPKDKADVMDEKEYTRQMLEKHAGKWVGDETAEDILSAIRENSSMREPVMF